MYQFKHIIGNFVVDSSLKSIQIGKANEQLSKEKIPQALQLLKDKKYFNEFYSKNILQTKRDIKKSVNEDNLIMQAIANINELDKVSNILSKRLREWYSLYLPEFSEEISNHEKFVELVSLSKKELMKQIDLKESMGADLEQQDVDEILLLAKQITNLYNLRKKHELYLEKVMKIYCPNIAELAGVTIAAKLIELAKGLKRLALLPSSTVQLLGAEKALFRHIKTGSKSPKYGVIINHPLIQFAKRTDKGKAARTLADKLSLCARLDYFKGEFKADEYRKELDEKFK